ncbi:MAG: twin-arginine translocation signal domain-containing protein, partial [Deltaproteobacteria bacterium]|nr:twin-arginine translocation signal domain-containing protein [Deltaproteobacteria bacterium]
MARLNRRDFLKALGLGGSVSALAACGLDDNRYLTPVEQFLPYVVKSEVHTPGTPTFFATTVTTGPSAFPVTARHREGRVVNIGANTRSPFAPAVPAAALLALQRQYSPDRYTAPRLREGSTWSDTDWETGLAQLSSAVKAARDGGKKIAYLGPYRSGSIVNLLQDYTGGEAVFWEPLGPEAEVEAAEVLFGQRVLPAYQLSGARYVLSFGAAFLGQWGNVHLAGQYADARDPNKGHFIARFAMVGPYLDQTGANCDDWYAVHPGAEA